MRQILVTSALPYANGHIHIGHMVEYLQTDIWVRFQRLRGNRCVYVCADDTHGTAIMMRAQNEGRSEEELIAEMSAAHQADFSGFGVSFDHYGSTNSDANREKCAEIWNALRGADMVVEREIEQLYDVEKGTFLADRFVRGTCPKCGKEDQPADVCSQCASTLSPQDLIDPVSALSGTTPEVRSAMHLFVQIEQLHQFLEDWIGSGVLQSGAANYIRNYFLYQSEEVRTPKALEDWDVSRPAPYFGFEIPDSPGNFWYVWFDAPIGYIASTQEWCDANGEDCDRWWKEEGVEIHHFIGKDIQYFHTLFWPAMLKTAGYRLPTSVKIHGFLTVNGKKMSKSEGTNIRASKYLEHLDPSYLRYYYASKLSSKVEDIDLNLEEFVSKVNGDLVGKVVNLASRTAKFVANVGLSEQYPDDGGLFEEGVKAGDEIAGAYEACEYSKAMRLIVDLADKANPFVENNAPWELRKDKNQAQRLQDVCSIALNLFRQIAIYLAPVLPKLADQVGDLLGDPITSWGQSEKPLEGTPVAKFKHMMARVDPKKVEVMVEESREEDPEEEGQPEGDWADGSEALEHEPLADEITIEDFLKVDLRVARVIAADEVPEARKLLKLTLSLGGGVQRTVFAGIKSAYKPEELVGRKVVMVANLKPRQMKFGLSEGMVVASGPGGKDVFLLGVDDGAQVGQRVH